VFGIKIKKDSILWLKEIIWLDKFAIKIRKKHNITIEEVEEALFFNAFFRRVKRGKVKGDDVYIGYSKTNAGRYLLIVFIYKGPMIGLVISARDMTARERKYYNAKKK
jgi:uncharacterized DUF497 family protein